MNKAKTSAIVRLRKAIGYGFSPSAFSVYTACYLNHVTREPPFSTASLARFLLMSRTTVLKALRELHDQGAIKYRPGRHAIADLIFLPFDEWKRNC